MFASFTLPVPPIVLIKVPTNFVTPDFEEIYYCSRNIKKFHRVLPESKVRAAPPINQPTLSTVLGRISKTPRGRELPKYAG